MNGYREGFGFVDEQDMSEMARLGIGMPPVDIRQMQIQQEQVRQAQTAQEQMPAQTTQQVTIQPLSDEERRAKVDSYLSAVLPRQQGYVQPTQQQVQTPSVAEVKNDDYMSSWFDEPKKVQTTEVKQESVRSTSYDFDPVIDYRRSIVDSALKMGKDPSEIEGAISSFTTDEMVVFAGIKLDYERQKQGMTSQAQQPRKIEFQSLKQRPTPSVVTASASNGFQGNEVTRTSVIGDRIMEQFYRR